jgi:hypothetical protein
MRSTSSACRRPRRRVIVVHAGLGARCARYWRQLAGARAASWPQPLQARATLDETIDTGRSPGTGDRGGQASASCQQAATRKKHRC